METGVGAAEASLAALRACDVLRAVELRKDLAGQARHLVARRA